MSSYSYATESPPAVIDTKPKVKYRKSMKSINSRLTLSRKEVLRLARQNMRKLGWTQ